MGKEYTPTKLGGLGRVHVRYTRRSRDPEMPAKQEEITEEYLIYLNVDVSDTWVELLYTPFDVVYLLPYQAWYAVGVLDAEFLEFLEISVYFFVLHTQSLPLIRFAQKRRPVEFDFALNPVRTESDSGRLKVDNLLYGRFGAQEFEHLLLKLLGHCASDKIRAILHDERDGNGGKQACNDNGAGRIPHRVAGQV